MKKFLIIFTLLVVIVAASAISLVVSINNSLPEVITLQDYKPLLVSNVFARDGRKIGEFYLERRVLVPFEKIPKVVVQAFMAAEDAEFYEHQGINFQAIARAMLVNIKAGHTVQGGSTITQQVAKTLMLSSERTITRKIKDVLLALKMEKSLSKEDIMYLYLNQIFLGQKSHGIGVAAETYFRKPVEKLNLAEAAMLAGLPQAPSRYSPVSNPKRAKERQIYVLHQMAEKGFVDLAQAEAAANAPIKVFIKEKYEEMAPFFLETVRQMLFKKLSSEIVNEQGIQVYTSLDFDKQIEAQKSVEKGLRDLDKRQGYRGALDTKGEDEVAQFLEDEQKKLREQMSTARLIDKNGEMTIIPEIEKLKVEDQDLPEWLPQGAIVQGVVTQVDDSLGLVYVKVPGAEGIVDMDSMKWARKPNPEVSPERETISKPSQALKIGDVIEVRIVESSFSSERLNKMASPKSKTPVKMPNFSKQLLLALEQEPTAEGALLSLDLQTDEVIAMVGGKDFKKSEFNRTIQATRQTGSSFKSIVYAAALDKGYTPATPILDAPVVFEEEVSAEDAEGQDVPKKKAEGEGDEVKQMKTWKPTNHSKTFEGDILFRNALVKSLNVPTVRIIEDIGVSWALDYAQRLGIFSPLNKDFTLALGSSSVTLYEMTKMFGHFGRLGKRLRPMMIHKVLDKGGKTLIQKISIDDRFAEAQQVIEENFEKRRKEYLELKSQVGASENNEELRQKLAKLPPLFFEDPDQLMDPTTAYLITTLLKATVEEAGGTGGRARALGREVAGKTGSTSGYFDAWFVGYTPQISTGVWVGFDQEKTLGVGEVGGRVALPIWVQFMLAAHSKLTDMNFPVPPGIVFASIDNVSGKLPTAASKNVIRQAFREGTEPSAASSRKDEETDFYKQDLSE
jgi:penicillin-binding protein 1A